MASVPTTISLGPLSFVNPYTPGVGIGALYQGSYAITGSVSNLGNTGGYVDFAFTISSLTTLTFALSSLTDASSSQRVLYQSRYFSYIPAPGLVQTNYGNQTVYEQYGYGNSQSITLQAGTYDFGWRPEFYSGELNINYKFNYLVSVTQADLFTPNSDSVDFNALLSSQIISVRNGAALYNSLGGGDTIVLPSASAATNLGGTGVSFDPTQLFQTGDGGSTVTGGDLGYRILLGAGANNVTLGDGNNTVADYILLPTATANNNIAVGTGSNTITFGDGNNFVGVAAGGTTSTDKITVGNGKNYVYGGTSTTSIIGGTGTNTFVSNSALTTMTGSGSSTTFQVVDGNTINGFASGDIIDVQVPDPSEQIDTSVVSTDGANTYIRTFDTTNFQTVSTTTLTGVYQTSNFFGQQVNGAKDNLQLSYSGQNPSTVFEGIETGVFDALGVINHTLDLAKSFAKNLAKDKTRDALLKTLFKVTVHFPGNLLNFSKLIYDLASSTTSFAFGDLTAEQYEVAFAKSLIDVDPTGLGSKVATIGSFIVSKWIDYYFAAIDASQGEPTTAVVPIKQVLTSVMPTLNSANGNTLLAVLAQRAQSGDVAQTTSTTGSFSSPTAGQTNVAVGAGLPDGAILSLPSGYDAVIAEGGGAVTLSDAGLMRAILVGNDGADTFNSTGTGATLVGGQGGNTFNVSGSATIATGDGANTVRATGNAAVDVATGTGKTTVVLAGGASTVQANGQDTVFGGVGAASVTTAAGAIVVGGAGQMSFVGGSATSIVFGGSGGINYTARSAYDIVVGVGGPLVGQTGAGGGQLWGNGGGDVLTAGSGQTVLYGTNGDKLISTGAAGNFLLAGAGSVTLDGSAAIGGDAFFGGTGNDTFLLGSGNDLVGTGTGTSTVQLGAGKDTVYAFGTSAIAAGTGNADIVFGTTSGSLTIASGAARDFALFNFVPGTERISLQGYSASAVSDALASQAFNGSQTVLTLADKTVIQLLGVTKADASFFGVG